LAIFSGTFATLLEPRLLGLAIDDAIIPKDLSRLRQIGLIFLGVVCADNFRPKELIKIRQTMIRRIGFVFPVRN